MFLLKIGGNAGFQRIFFLISKELPCTCPCFNNNTLHILFSLISLYFLRILKKISTILPLAIKYFNTYFLMYRDLSKSSSSL